MVVLGWGLLVHCGAREAPPLLGAPLSPELSTSLPKGPTETAGLRQQVVAVSQSMLGGGATVARGLTFSADPVGFVRAAYWHVGLDLIAPELTSDPTATGMALLYRSASARNWLHTESPNPGDLVFFDADETAGMTPSQVAIVERIANDGTLWLIGYFAKGPARIAMNLREPETITRQTGERVNDLLADSDAIPAAQLFRTFADPFRED